MTALSAAGQIGAGIVGAVLLIAAAMACRPEQPVVGPLEQARRDLAARVQDEYDREEDQRDRADDDVNENQGDDEQ